MLKPVGLDWITALRAPTIKSLLEQGAFQLSLFDERDLAEVGSPEFPDVSRRQGTTHRQAGVDRYSDRDMAAVAVVNVNAPMQEAQMRLEQLTWSERVVSPLDGLITSRKVDVEPSRTRPPRCVTTAAFIFASSTSLPTRTPRSKSAGVR